MIRFLVNRVGLRRRINLAAYATAIASLLAIMLAFLGFQQVAEEFRRFVDLSDKSQASLALSYQISEMHRAAEQFTHEGHPSAADQVLNGHALVKSLIEQIRSDGLEERPFRLDTTSRHLDAYVAAFQELQKQRVRQRALVQETIRAQANEAEQLISDYLASLPAEQLMRRIRALEALNNLLLVKQSAYRYFDTLDAEAVEQAKKGLESTLQSLLAIDRNDRRLHTGLATEQISRVIQTYRNSFLEAVQRTRGYLYLVNVVMAAEANEILYQSSRIQELYRESMQGIERQILSSVRQVMESVLLFGFGLLTAAVALSYVIGQSVSLPITRLTETFRALAAGSSDTLIPRYRPHDEIGDLTHAAAVFRQNNIKTRQLLQQYQELSGSLETKVEQRTRELEISNQQLLEAKDAAESATRAKSAFLANMSHEIRTPMHAIMGMNYLLRQTRLDQAQASYAENIDLSANTMLSLINDILDFSKIEAGKLELESTEFDLQAKISDVATLVASRVKVEAVDFCIDYDPGLPARFIGDPVRVGQILTNLLNNAAKFTEQGAIGLRVSAAEQGGLSFCVWDTGIGIAAEAKERLFSAFSQADAGTTRQYGGSGLGLTITRQLVEMMQGRIELHSEPGRGSRFCATLALQGVDDRPVAGPVFEGRRLGLALAAKATGGPLGHLSRALGLAFIEIPDSAQVLAWIQANPDSGVLVIDASMQPEAALSLVRAVRKQAGEAQKLLCLMPPLADVARRQEMLQAGADALLAKPVLPAAYQGVLHELFDDSAAEQQAESNSKPVEENPGEPCVDRLLVVDDNPVNRQILSGMLAHSGIGIEEASNGREALEKYLDDPSRFRLILMDLQMPEMDGYEATRRIRKVDSSVPIFALTANAMATDVSESLAQGMNGHLSKPIEIGKLEAVLRKYFPESRGLESAARAELPPGELTMPSLQRLRRVDVGAGLSRTLGDEALYSGLLQSFYQDNADQVEALRALPGGDPEVARRRVHSLKGTAGNIGAIRLHALASKANQSMEPLLLGQLVDELKAVLDDIVAAGLADQTPGDPASSPLSGTDPASLFDALAEQVRRRRPREIAPLLAQLSASELPEASADMLERLKPLLRKYRYAEAAELMEQESIKRERL